MVLKFPDSVHSFCMLLAIGQQFLPILFSCSFLQRRPIFVFELYFQFLQSLATRFGQEELDKQRRQKAEEEENEEGQRNAHRVHDQRQKQPVGEFGQPDGNRAKAHD